MRTRKRFLYRMGVQRPAILMVAAAASTGKSGLKHLRARHRGKVYTIFSWTVDIKSLICPITAYNIP